MKYNLADRMKNLGTETAFAVSKEASEFEKTGKKIFSFHLGDINIITPLHIICALEKAVIEGHTNYCSPAGIIELREALASEINQTRGLSINADNISIQSGGKPVISKFFQILMNRGNEVLYPNPGYPLYESWIDFLRGVRKPYRMIETKNGFAIDMEQLKKSITPKTKIFAYVNHHNPTGARSSKEEMGELAEICIANNLFVLSDEAYFDIAYDGDKRSIASLPEMFERTIILYSFSKKYAMTGWRLGAAVGPKEIIDEFNNLNINVESCTNHAVQWAGLEALTGSQTEAEIILNTLKERRNACADLINNIRGFSVHKPNCTFYLFPNVTEAMKTMKIESVESFRKLILKKTGVSFCTREHFGTPFEDETEKYIRLAYSGIDIDKIKEGLTKLKDFVESF